MTKNSTTVLISVIVAVLIIFGIYYWSTNSGSAPVANTYPTPQPTTPDTGTGRQSGLPIVSTKTASFISQSGAVLNGDVNPNGTQTSYWYEYGETQTLGCFTSPQLIGGGYVTYGAPEGVSGLKPNSAYYFRLVAQNKYGKVYGEVLNLQTTNTPPLRYAPPTIQTRDPSAISTNSATLNGMVNPNNSNTLYWFEYGQDFSLGNTTPTSSLNASNSNMMISSNIAGLDSGKIYYFRLNAQNAYGTVNGNISVFSTQPVNPPPPPVGNAPTAATNPASGITTSSAVLNGQINPNGSATTYHFEYGKSTLFGLFTLTQSTDTKSAGSGTRLASYSQSITGLDSDSTYYYQVITQNQYGTSRGAIYSFTTKKTQ